MISDAESFHSTSKALKFTATEAFESGPFETSFAERGTNASAAKILTAGAVEIVLEMLRRFPLRGKDEDILTWFGSAARLGRAITALGLWGELSAKPWGPVLDLAGEGLRKRLPSPMHRKLSNIFYSTRGSGLGLVEALLLQNFFAGWHPYEVKEFLYRMRHRMRPFSFPASMTSTAPATDPIDDLACWPVTKQLALLAGAPVAARASVYDLLCLVISAPDVLHEGQPAIAERATALSIFAAAHITAAPNAVPALGLMATELGNAALNRVTNVAARWLADQFPKYIFPRPIEDLIRTASKLAYA